MSLAIRRHASSPVDSHRSRRSLARRVVADHDGLVVLGDPSSDLKFELDGETGCRERSEAARAGQAERLDES